VPIYEYKCRQNGHVFEARQGFNDPEFEACEICQGPVDRLVSSSAFHLKGSGWYSSDYKAKPSSETVTTKEKTESKKIEPSKSEPSKSEPSKSEPSK